MARAKKGISSMTSLADTPLPQEGVYAQVCAVQDAMDEVGI